MLSKREWQKLFLFMNAAKSVCRVMIRDTRYPELQTIYSRILENLNHVPINIRPGEFLEAEGAGVTYGMNLKRLEGGLLKSAIRVPHDHLFDDNGNIRIDGALTLLHEMSHVILPDSAHNFTARVGLPWQHTDEFFADILSAHIAKNLGFRSEQIGRHLFNRRSYFGGFPIDRFAIEGRRGVAKEIERGRFIPRATRRPEPRDPFRTPTEPQHILPGRPEGPPSWLPGLGKGGRRPLKEFNRRI